MGGWGRKYPRLVVCLWLLLENGAAFPVHNLRKDTPRVLAVLYENLCVGTTPIYAYALLQANIWIPLHVR